MHIIIVTRAIFDLQGFINLSDPNNNSLSEFHCTLKLNINTSQFCLLG